MKAQDKLKDLKSFWIFRLSWLLPSPILFIFVLSPHHLLLSPSPPLFPLHLYASKVLFDRFSLG
jgi:hypothetical protein